MSIAKKLTTIAENTNKVYEAGYNNGSLPLYYVRWLANMWQNAVFPENTELTIRVKGEENHCGSTFQNTKYLKSVKLVSDNPDSAIVAGNMFRESKNLELIDLTEFNRKFSTAEYFALSDSNLKTVLGAIDLSECTNVTYMFWIDGAKLEDVEFVPNTIKLSMQFNFCAKLTDISIQSIIDGLADLTDSDTQTLTFHATVGAKLTDTQKATITAKNWTLAY